jgi:hypothetical protein
LVGPVDPLRLLIAQFLQSERQERPAIGQAIFDLIDADVQQWWRYCHPEGTPIAEGARYEAFRQEVFNDLMTGLGAMKRVEAFPFVLLAALERDLLDRLWPREGAFEKPQSSTDLAPSGRTGKGRSPFINRTLVRWYADQLGERERLALELRCVDEVGFDETARIMHLTEGGLRSALTRGVRYIRLYATREWQGRSARRMRRRGGSTP